MSNTDGGTVSQFAGHDGGGGNRHSSPLHHLSISEPVNVWDLPEIQKYKKSLVRKLFPSTIRLACVSFGLINNDQQQMLFMVEEDSAKHNERLLNYIYPSGDNLDHFQVFINQLEGPYFEAIKDKFQEVKDRLQDEKTARIQQIDGSSQQPCELVVNNPPPGKEPSLALPPAIGDLDGQQRASGTTSSYGQQQYSSPLDNPELMSKLRKVIINGRNPNRTILAKFQLQVQGCISHFVRHKHVERVLPRAYCDGIRKTYPDPHMQAEKLVEEWTRKALFHFSAATLMHILQATGYEHAFYDSIKDDVT
eukprot:scpid66521/ scgid32610/ 